MVPLEQQTTPGIESGASLWWVTSANSREEGEVTVLSVDGQRALLSNGATLDLQTMNAIADPVPRGRCYRTRDEHMASLRLQQEWADFVMDVRSTALPKALTVADIGAIRQLLGIGPNQRER
jgi:hypothetical protein